MYKILLLNEFGNPLFLIKSFFRINRLKVKFDEKLGVEFHSNELRQLRNLDSFRSELILLFSYIWWFAFLKGDDLNVVVIPNQNNSFKD